MKKLPIVYPPLVTQVGWDPYAFQAVKVKVIHTMKHVMKRQMGDGIRKTKPKLVKYLGNSGVNVNIHEPTEIGNIVRDVIKRFTDQSNLYHRQNIGRRKESNKTLKWIDILQTGMKKKLGLIFLIIYTAKL
ncbi:hypothetical protein C0J52_04316 [Blattella germanica]|nr:hypothetical protein C0J52_04316 [Blattella germanica]